MFLPLVDGIFPALVLAGALADPAGVVEVGLLVFGGSATVAVILAEMDGTPRERSRTVLAVGAGLLVLATVETALAPTIASALDLAVFERFAALVILAVAATTASARVGEYLPRPAVIVGLGMLASLDPAGAELVTTLDPALLVRGGAAAGVAVAFALALARCGPWLEDVVDLDRFRFGSAVALGVLTLSVLGFIPTDAPVALAVLGVTALFAFDPDGSTTPRPAVDGETDASAPAADGPATGGEAASADAANTAADDGPDSSAAGERDDALVERAPWL